VASLGVILTQAHATMLETLAFVGISQRLPWHDS
jgi:hypothetical protein